MNLTQQQWKLVEPIITQARPCKEIPGRPRQDDQQILNGILWICRTGAPWKDLPDKYPPYQTCQRRFQEWVKVSVWESILTALAIDLKKRGKMDLAETFIDGSFAAAKKGAAVLAKLSGAGVPRSWQLQTAMVYLSPFPHLKQAATKLKLVEKTLSKRFVKTKPGRMIGDKAYDSDKLDKQMNQQRIKMIAPHKKNRKSKPTQHGRELRRYKKRGKVERLFAWIQNFRRSNTRYEYYEVNFLGFIQLACAVILIRNYF